MINLLIKIIFGKEGNTMVAMLWVTRIVSGKKTFKDVPRLLKDQVRELLIEADLEYLIDEE